MFNVQSKFLLSLHFFVYSPKNTRYDYIRYASLNYFKHIGDMIFPSTLFEGSFQRESSGTFSRDLKVYLQELVSVSALDKKEGSWNVYSNLLALQHTTVTARTHRNELLFC